MAKTRAAGYTGAFTSPDHHADFGLFNVRIAQQVDSTANYADTYWESHNGSQCVAAEVTASGFQAYGASSTSPHVDTITAGGSTLTLTFATGCTLTGLFCIEEITLGNARKSGASPMTLKGVNAGTLTFAWAES